MTYRFVHQNALSCGTIFFLGLHYAYRSAVSKEKSETAQVVYVLLGPFAHSGVRLQGRLSPLPMPLVDEGQKRDVKVYRLEVIKIQKSGTLSKFKNPSVRNYSVLPFPRLKQIKIFKSSGWKIIRFSNHASRHD